MGGLGVVEGLGARLISHLAIFSLVPLEVAAPSSTIVKTFAPPEIPARRRHVCGELCSGYKGSGWLSQGQ